jgi:hypothetical protein
MRLCWLDAPKTVGGLDQAAFLRLWAEDQPIPTNKFWI